MFWINLFFLYIYMIWIYRVVGCKGVGMRFGERYMVKFYFNIVVSVFFGKVFFCEFWVFYLENGDSGGIIG